MPVSTLLFRTDLFLKLKSCHPVARGFARAGVGNPDEARAARYILKDYVNGKLLYCHPPPDVSPEEFNAESHSDMLKRLQESGKKMAPTTRVAKGAVTSTFEPLLPAASHTSNGSSSPLLPPLSTDSAKTRALDKDFFENQAMASRPFVQGSARNGTQVSRNTMYPHQNVALDDGTVTDGRQAANMVVSGGGKPSKKHFKAKRTKLRTGNPAVGYD